MNCWEFKKCGREGGGTKSIDLGTCPAYPEYGQQCARVLPEHFAAARCRVLLLLSWETARNVNFIKAGTMTRLIAEERKIP